MAVSKLVVGLCGGGMFVESIPMGLYFLHRHWTPYEAHTAGRPGIMAFGFLVAAVVSWIGVGLSADWQSAGWTLMIAGSALAVLCQFALVMWAYQPGSSIGIFTSLGYVTLDFALAFALMALVLSVVQRPQLR